VFFSAGRCAAAASLFGVCAHGGGSLCFFAEAVVTRLVSRAFVELVRCVLGVPHLSAVCFSIVAFQN